MNQEGGNVKSGSSKITPQTNIADMKKNLSKNMTNISSIKKKYQNMDKKLANENIIQRESKENLISSRNNTKRKQQHYSHLSNTI